MARIKYAQCMIRDCEKPHMSKGFCNRHYQQMWKHGRILPDEMPIEDLAGELWADIEEAEGYQVSSMGRVKSLVGRGKLITPQIEKRSHMLKAIKRVYLDRRATRGWVKFLYVHLEVAKAFLPNTHGDSRVVFKNGDSLDCRVENLAWFWDEAPVYSDNLWAFRQSVCSELGEKVLSFIEGNDNALNDFMLHHTPKMRRYLFSRYGNSVDGTMVDDAIHLTFLKGLRDIRRGLLKSDDNIAGWFNTISHNQVLDEIKKKRGRKELQQYGFNGDGEEFDRFATLEVCQ